MWTEDCTRPMSRHVVLCTPSLLNHSTTTTIYTVTCLCQSTCTDIFIWFGITRLDLDTNVLTRQGNSTICKASVESVLALHYSFLKSVVSFVALLHVDPVVLASTARFWSSWPGPFLAVCHWHIQSPPPGFCCARRHEWCPEVSDPPWW